MVVHHRIQESIYSVVKDYNVLLGRRWVSAFTKEHSFLSSAYMNNLQCYIDESYKKTAFTYPKVQNDIFKAFNKTDPDNIKVVIFGDEPAPSHYSNGLAFGAYKTSLVNPHNELKCSKHIKSCLHPEILDQSTIDFDTTLLNWAEQDVLLLNTSLISKWDSPMLHEQVFRHFIRKTIQIVSDLNVDVVFVFTSKSQEEKFEKYIDTDFHTILHYNGIDPDSSMFEDINQVLEEKGANTSINW